MELFLPDETFHLLTHLGGRHDQVLLNELSVLQGVVYIGACFYAPVTLKVEIECLLLLLLSTSIR